MHTTSSETPALDALARRCRAYKDLKALGGSEYEGNSELVEYIVDEVADATRESLLAKLNCGGDNPQVGLLVDGFEVVSAAMRGERDE